MAHSLRNRLTASTYSLSLSFTLFLLLQYRLLRQQQDYNRLLKRGAFPFLESAYSGILTPERVEPVLRRHGGILEGWSWLPFESRR